MFIHQKTYRGLKVSHNILDIDIEISTDPDNFWDLFVTVTSLVKVLFLHAHAALFQGRNSDCMSFRALMLMWMILMVLLMLTLLMLMALLMLLLLAIVFHRIVSVSVS